MARIYVSSTYSDLSEARSAVVRVLRQLGHDVVAMEDYLASDERPLDRCLADVAGCDAYVGILAWRYGYVPPDQARSITELEFREADRLGTPTLFFLLHEDAPWPRSQIDRDPTRIETLRADVSRDLLVSFFRDTSELSALVGTAVTNLERSRSRQAVPRVATHFLRTPQLGIQILQDGRPNPLLRAEAGRIAVPMGKGPFELRIPDVEAEDHVKITASYDPGIFTQVEGTVAHVDVEFFRPGTGMADTGYGSGELWLTDHAHMYLDWGGRLMPDGQGGGVVLFHSITSPGGAEEMPWDRTVYVVVHLVKKGAMQVTPYNAERLVLRF